MNDAGLKIGFLDPDLGIGGAVRVVVDAALRLQRAVHRALVFAGAYAPRLEESREVLCESGRAAACLETVMLEVAGRGAAGGIAAAGVR